MTKLSSRSTSRLTKAGIAVGGFTSLLLLGTAVPAMAAVPGTLSVTSGPSGGGNTITMAATNAFTVASPVVEFQAVTATSTGCSALYKAAASVTAATTSPYASTGGVVLLTTPATRLTTSKIVISVPAGVALATNQTTSKFYVCVYDSTSTTASTLLATATYTIAAAPTLTAQPTGVAPTSGPALGGNTITLTGTGFVPGATTVTVGGTAATGVTVNAAGTSITATAPSHVPGTALPIVITTTGGTLNFTSPGYTFSNGVNVTPNTSPNTTNPTLDITGAGFSSLTWATDIDATGISAPTTTNGARVVLTNNTWANTNAAGFAGAGGQVFPSTTVYPVAQCGGILPISDGEIICTLDLTDALTYASSKYALNTGVAVPNGSYQVTVANNDAATGLTTAANNYSITSSGSTFTVAPF